MLSMTAMHFKMAAIFISCLFYAHAVDYEHLRLMAAKHNMTCILVFGDSTVDPGNNNRLSTQQKSNFPPYGMDFFHSQPSGRFCNGRLATDFVAEALGHVDLVWPFLNPAITRKNMLHGVSFASAGSGYDELTANITNVVSISKQLDYLRHYKIHLRNLVGRHQSEEIIANALVVLSMGTNDFLVNYYMEPIRAKQYSIEQYQNYLISCLRATVKTMYSLGVRKLAVVGLPPLGCIPLIRTLYKDIKCDIEMNRVASSFNTKIQKELKMLQGPRSKSVYLDIYSIILNAVESPRKYGFAEPLKGCVGSGMYEYASSCKNLSTCHDRTKYVFWDAVHPTEKMHKIIADDLIEVILGEIF